MPSSSSSSVAGSYRTRNYRDPLELTADAGPTTPTTTAAVHRFDELTAEASGMPRTSRKPFRRDSTRIQQWVLDHDQQLLQQSPSDDPPDSPDSAEPPAPSSGSGRIEESSSECFVVVEESDEMPRPGRDAFNSHKTLRAMPPPAPRTPRKSSGIASTPPAGNGSPSTALRNFHLSFSSHSRRPSNTTASITTRSPSPSRSSILRRPATIDTQTSYTQSSSNVPSLVSPKPTRAASEFGALSHANESSTWKLKRPTVLGHFLIPSNGQPDEANFPRPSTSSTFTQSSTTFTQPSTDTLSTPPNKMSWGRSSPASFFRSSQQSLWSLPTSASHLNDPPYSTKVIARDNESDRSTFRHSVRGGTSTNGLALLGSPRRRKKRKLIISGIPQGDHSRFEGVRRWCESFGEVNQITRLHNGDLHIDFRKNEVADTVCRLNARVYIAGVGSVGLSWFTGKRP
ncbi:hypothetical protein EIP91_011553 [Steccherinum ochraceum]|uniref:Uncharacterized protein n=1 Tax=Steccherinum ochraceum TaxID=92696 RepID=A0A4R0RHT7_9APHY|nr:hypothetical protein EIP91_011553 [Steccherinum ochraceum]